MIDTLSAKVQSMALKITRLQEAGVVLVVAWDVRSSVKGLEPAPFDGAQSAKTLENFFRDVG